MSCTPSNWRGLLVIAAVLALVLAVAPFTTPRTGIDMVGMPQFAISTSCPSQCL
jgi:hypothetical protein